MQNALKKPSIATKQRGAHGLFAALLLVLVPGLAAAQGAAPPIEYQVKASLVYNFLLFIEWPERTPRTRTLCSVGRNVYGGAIEALHGEVVQGNTLNVMHIAAPTPNSASACDILLFNGRLSNRERQLLASACERSVLTIGEDPDFLRRCGIIRFVLIEDTVQFNVNLRAARDSGLALSSKLLRLADTVLGNE